MENYDSIDPLRAYKAMRHGSEGVLANDINGMKNWKEPTISPRNEKTLPDKVLEKTQAAHEEYWANKKKEWTQPTVTSRNKKTLPKGIVSNGTAARSYYLDYVLQGPPKPPKKKWSEPTVRQPYRRELKSIPNNFATESKNAYIEYHQTMPARANNGLMSSDVELWDQPTVTQLDTDSLPDEILEKGKELKTAYDKHKITKKAWDAPTLGNIEADEVAEKTINSKNTKSAAKNIAKKTWDAPNLRNIDADNLPKNIIKESSELAKKYKATKKVAQETAEQSMHFAKAAAGVGTLLAGALLIKSMNDNKGRQTPSQLYSQQPQY